MLLLQLTSFIVLFIWHVSRIECRSAALEEFDETLKKRFYSALRGRLFNEAKYREQWRKRFNSYATNDNDEEQNSDAYSGRDLSHDSIWRDYLRQSIRQDISNIDYARPISDPTCGHQHYEPMVNRRIIGGSEAKPHSWPWQVLYEETIPCKTNGGSCVYMCGGTLISSNYVLTAAHCHKHKTPEGIKITAGVHNQNNAKEATSIWQVRKVKTMLAHPRYNDQNYENDLSILELDQPVVFNQYVQPACLPGPDPLPNSEFVLLGWGNTKTDGEDSPVLKQSKAILLDTCAKKWDETNDALQLCFIDPQVISSTCTGDSGGPALQKVGDQWIVQGVLSYGEKICEVKTHGKPDVFVRVSAYLPWIYSIINK